MHLRRVLQGQRLLQLGQHAPVPAARPAQVQCDERQGGSHNYASPRHLEDVLSCRVEVIQLGLGPAYQSPANRRTASGSACPARARAWRRRRPRRSGPCFACASSKATSDAKAAMSPAVTIASPYESTLARTPELFPETGKSRSKSPAAVNLPPEGSARVMTWPRTTSSANMPIAQYLNDLTYRRERAEFAAVLSGDGVWRSLASYAAGATFTSNARVS